MNLNLVQDAKEAGDWPLGVLKPGPPSAPALSNAPAVLSAIETAFVEVAEDAADEAIAKLPGGEIALKLGGPYLDLLIQRLALAGFSRFPGWTPAPLPSAPLTSAQAPAAEPPAAQPS